MGEQSAPRLEGDRYQHLYSWYLLLQLLEPESPYERGTVENPDSGSADDITLDVKPGSKHPSKFYQVKWHTTQVGTYSVGSLTDVLTGTRSLIGKLFDSWKKLHNPSQQVEIWLVSNWASASDDIGQFIHSREYRLVETFFKGGARSKAGKCRSVLNAHLKASEEEVQQFCRALRFRLGFQGISDLEEMVDDRMKANGLTPGENARSVVADEMRTWIEKGGPAKVVTRESIQEVIARRDLRIKEADTPPLSLWVHGWVKQSYGTSPTVELDWTGHFDRDLRKVPSQETWNKTLFPELERVKARFNQHQGPKRVDFRGRLPLTTSIAIGSRFPEVAGFVFRIEQMTQGKLNLWSSDAAPSSRVFNVRRETVNQYSLDLIVCLSVSGNAEPDVERLVQNSHLVTSTVIFAEPDSGIGENVVKSENDATALAISAKKLIREVRQKYKSQRTHVILFGPASVATFLGMQLNALGKLVTYERTVSGEYQSSVTIQTG